jgi:hypothetical protein
MCDQDRIGLSGYDLGQDVMTKFDKGVSLGRSNHWLK